MYNHKEQFFLSEKDNNSIGCLPEISIPVALRKEERLYSPQTWVYDIIIHGLWLSYPELLLNLLDSISHP